MNSHTNVDFYKSPRRGVTINDTVQAMYAVATERE